MWLRLRKHVSNVSQGYRRSNAIRPDIYSRILEQMLKLAEVALIFTAAFSAYEMRCSASGALTSIAVNKNYEIPETIEASVHRMDSPDVP